VKLDPGDEMFEQLARADLAALEGAGQCGGGLEMERSRLSHDGFLTSS
jgi:hypothetical protein